MSIGSVDFDLDFEGRRCIVSELGAKQARAVTARLLNSFGGALHEAGLAGPDANADVVALGGFLERLKEADLEWLTDAFYKVTKVEKEVGGGEFVNVAQIHDLVFGGGVGMVRWFKWLAFCVELTCGAFFAEARSEVAKRQTATKKASPSQTGSPSLGGTTA